MAYLLAVLTGILTAASFPLLEWWPLIFVAYVPMMIAMNEEPLMRRMRIGWVAGAVTLLGIQYWISHTMVFLSGFPWWAAILVLLGYAATFGLSHALFGALYGLIRTYSGRAAWIAIAPVAWVIIERTFPALFPFYAGNALFRTPVLMQSAEFIGIGGISALIMLTNCAVAHAVEERARGRASDYFVPIATSCLWLILATWGAVRMHQVWSLPTKSNLAVAMIQPNVSVAEKRDRTWVSRIEAWNRTIEMTEAALSMSPDLLIWPEGGFPFQFILDSKDTKYANSQHPNHMYSRRLYKMALDLNLDFIAGGLSRRGDRTRNSAMFFPRNEQRVEMYDKQHLLPFGEHIPFADRFPSLKTAIQGMTHHEPGAADHTWDIDGVRLAVGICYEAIFPSIARRQMNHNDADVLLNLTNDVWFGDTAAPHLHLMVQQARTIEMRSWLIRSTNSGVSAFIAPTGQIQAIGEQGSEEIIALDVPIPNLPASVYRRFGDLWLYVYLAICALYLSYQYNAHRKKENPTGNLTNVTLSMDQTERDVDEVERS
ncbi:MAG: apolipoprotein N-acyltransferase [Myxococcota bacterium]|nr:apolipoprotein N-acyltransferase [Myxococcota bacterium]